MDGVAASHGPADQVSRIRALTALAAISHQDGAAEAATQMQSETAGEVQTAKARAGGIHGQTA